MVIIIRATLGSIPNERICFSIGKKTDLAKQKIESSYLNSKMYFLFLKMKAILVLNKLSIKNQVQLCSKYFNKNRKFCGFFRQPILGNLLKWPKVYQLLPLGTTDGPPFKSNKYQFWSFSITVHWKGKSKERRIGNWLRR